MSLLIQNTIKEVEKFNDSIKTELSSKGIDNTGAASQSIRVESDKNKVSSKGVFYLEYLNRGRPPGKFPPLQAIETWLSEKGLDIPVFLVARKIANFGTGIFQDKSKGILLEEKQEKLKETIMQESPKWAKQDILIELKKIKITTK